MVAWWTLRLSSYRQPHASHELTAGEQPMCIHALYGQPELPACPDVLYARAQKETTGIGAQHDEEVGEVALVENGVHRRCSVPHWIGPARAALVWLVSATHGGSASQQQTSSMPSTALWVTRSRAGFSTSDAHRLNGCLEEWSKRLLSK